MTFGDTGSATSQAPWAVDLHGDVKTFVLGSFAYPLTRGIPGIPDPPDVVGTGVGAADFRLKLGAHGQNWSFDVHHALDVLSTSGAAALGSGSGSLGVGLTAPQLVDLTWEPNVGDALTVRGRIDRLVFALTPPHLGVTIGRQPVSFGTGLVFTPLDLVNPFAPATIDTEYKPGVDAVRVDGYAGTAGRVTAVAAWTGPLTPYDPDADPVALEDLVLAVDGQTTVGVTDLQGFAGLVRHDAVLGGAVESSIGPIGVHGDATITVPGPEAVEDQPFVRAVVGGMGRPTGKTTVTGEAYVQTVGASSAATYLDAFDNPRFQRGELTFLGRYYAAASVAQEFTPLLTGSAAVIANLQDPSALVVPSLSWSVANEATVVVGGYLGVGAHADPITLQHPTLRVHSEFGLYPDAVYVSMRSYF